MNRFVRSILVVLLASMLVSCAGITSTPADPNKMIEPGDKIGDFLITTGKEGDVIYGWQLDKCVHQDDKKINLCPTIVGTKVNVSVGIYDDTYSGKLDSLWSEHTYEMFIAGRLVNLQAFGYIDITHPVVGKMRYWNVVVTTTQIAEITVTAKGIVGGEPIEDSTTFSFTAP